jgi:hypothetical protein
VPVRQLRRWALGGEAVARPARGAFRPAVGRHFVGWRGASCVGSSAACGWRPVAEALCVAVHCGGGLRRGFGDGVVVGVGRWGEVASSVWRSSVGWRRRRWASRICGVIACFPVGSDMGGGGLLLASVLGAYLSRNKCRGRVWLPDVVPGAGWWWLVVVGDLSRPRAQV